MQITGRTVTIEQKLYLDDLHLKLLRSLQLAIKSNKKSCVFKIRDGSIEEEITIKHLYQLNEFGLIKIDTEDDFYRCVYKEGNIPVSKILDKIEKKP